MEEKNYFDFFSDENKTKEESIDLSFDDNSFEKTQNINLNSYGQIKKNHKTKIKANDIRLLNQLRKSTINEVINELPKDKEYFHIVSNGSFDYFGIVKRIIELNPNDNFIFYGSTWTMNYDNTDDLINLINLGKIIDCTMITGEYLQQREPIVFQYLKQGLYNTGKGRLKAFKNHSKIIMLSNNKDKYFVCEGSANFTANPRLEQFIITNNKDLFNFHKNWIDELFIENPTNPTK